MMTYRELKAAQESKTQVFFYEDGDDITLERPLSGLVTDVRVRLDSFKNSVHMIACINDTVNCEHCVDVGNCFCSIRDAMVERLRDWEDIARKNKPWLVSSEWAGITRFAGLSEVYLDFQAEITNMNWVAGKE
jgi:hypothetical protein